MINTQGSPRFDSRPQSPLRPNETAKTQTRLSASESSHSERTSGSPLGILKWLLFTAVLLNTFKHASALEPIDVTSERWFRAKDVLRQGENIDYWLLFQPESKAEQTYTRLTDIAI